MKNVLQHLTIYLHLYCIYTHDGKYTQKMENDDRFRPVTPVIIRPNERLAYPRWRPSLNPVGCRKIRRKQVPKCATRVKVHLLVDQFISIFTFFFKYI